MILCIFILSGCAAQKRGEKVNLLTETVNIEPVKATGTCKFHYTDEKGKKGTESFPIRLWYLKNDKFCFYGDVAFDPKGVGFAIDEGSYWLYAKPLKIFERGYLGDEIYTKFYVEAEDFRKVDKSSFTFPQKLIYNVSESSNGKNFLEIKLNSVKLWNPIPQQVTALFTPPEANEIYQEKK